MFIDTFSLRGLMSRDHIDARSFIKASGMGAIAIASLIAGAVAACLLLALSIGLDTALFAMLMAALLPVAYVHRSISRYDEEVESRAPEFFYDLSEQTKASGSIVKALKRVSRHEYGLISSRR
jgi:flagellar protein FlaJ